MVTFPLPLLKVQENFSVVSTVRSWRSSWRSNEQDPRGPSRTNCVRLLEFLGLVVSTLSPQHFVDYSLGFPTLTPVPLEVSICEFPFQ